MRVLPELGQRRDAPIDITFMWFGEEMRVGQRARGAGVGFIAQAASIDMGTQHSKAHQVTLEFLQRLVDERDWPRFIELASENGLEVFDLLAVARSLVEAVVEDAAAFPTGRPSASSDGPPNTEPKSRDGYSSAVTKAMRDSHGRPDIKMIIWQAHQAIAGQTN